MNINDGASVSVNVGRRLDAAGHAGVIGRRAAHDRVGGRGDDQADP
jgi:hypothetical protein